MARTVSAFDGLPTLRFTGEDVMRMLQAGVLREHDHVELIEGRLIEMTPQGPAHGVTITYLADLIRDARPAATHVMSQRPLDVSADTWPEPDIALLRGATRDYWERHPTGADALLVVEIAFSSQEIDRRKASLYASAGVPVYWLIDLAARRIEVRTDPTGTQYKLTRLLEAGESIELPGTDVSWLVDDLVGDP